MNLQVCVPYEPCPFKCAMCIANGRKRFNDLYTSNREQYLEALRKAVESGRYDTYVLTGDTEPTLNSHWMKDVLEVLQNENTELQTRNYNLKGYNLKHLKTINYSITDIKGYLKSWRYRKIDGNNRLVILLTKEFNFLTAKNFEPMDFNQITFKVLQPTNDTKTNQWIEENEMKDFTNIYEIVEKFNGEKVSVRIDTSCQDSHGRYEIFRSDGKVYGHWSDEEPIER